MLIRKHSSNRSPAYLARVKIEAYDCIALKYHPLHLLNDSNFHTNEAYIPFLRYTWLGEMDDETRKSMTSSVFSLFEATGMDRFSSMSQQKWKSTEAIISSIYGLPKEKRRELIFLLNQLFKSGGQTAISKLQSLSEHSKN